MRLLDLFKKIKPNSVSQKITVNSLKHVESRETTFPDGSFSVSLGPDTFSDDFFGLSQAIESEKDIYAKIALCEKSYHMLPEFVRFSLAQDGELPPFINCRDIGPAMYMRLGKWEQAESAIRKCIAANAYYPDDGQAELDDLSIYKAVATKIVGFLTANPGFLQKDIYKNIGFSPEEKEQAKYFCRSSLQIRKEPFGKTNKLYVN